MGVALTWGVTPEHHVAPSRGCSKVQMQSGRCSDRDHSGCCIELSQGDSSDAEQGTSGGRLGEVWGLRCVPHRRQDKSGVQAGGTSHIGNKGQVGAHCCFVRPIAQRGRRKLMFLEILERETDTPVSSCESPWLITGMWQNRLIRHFHLPT